MLSPLSPLSCISSPSQSSASTSKQQKIPVSLSQLYKDIQTLPEEIRDQLVPREDLFVELNKPVHISPWQKASAALKKLSFRHPFRTTLNNMVSAWNSSRQQRLNAAKTVLLTSSNSFDKRNNEYLKEALRTGNQPLFLTLLKKAQNPDLAPLIKRAVIDGNETVFSEIVKKVDKPLPKETMNWLAEYGKPEKLATLLEKVPADSYTNEEQQAWKSLAESQHAKIETAKKQSVLETYTQLSTILSHITDKADTKLALGRLGNPDDEIAQTLRGELTQLEERDAENRLNFMAYSQHLNVSKALQRKYLKTLEKALLAEDHASLDTLLNVPHFQKAASLASRLPVIAARIGNLEGLQRLLDMPGISVNQIYMQSSPFINQGVLSQAPLHAAAKHGHKEIVEHLLSRVGIDVNLKDFFEETALDIAKQNNHPAIVELLEAHKAK